MGEVVQMENLAAYRAKAVAAGDIIEIWNMKQAISYGDQWQAMARRMSVELALATAQRDASDLLLRIATEELERMKGLK